MVKTDEISIQREDLTLSPLTVRVRYEMRNEHDEPVTLRIAFPMPEVPLDTPVGMNIYDPDGKMTAHTIDWPHNGGPNFLGFTVWVNGKNVEPGVDVRANLPDGRNIVQALQQIGGWWLVMHPRVYLRLPSIAVSQEADRDIGSNMIRQLHDLGAVEGEDPIIAKWKTRITFYWMQTFDPGVTIIEHRYQPVVGYFGFRPKREAWSRDIDDALDRAYCLNEENRNDLQKLLTPSDHDYLVAQTLGYILTTGANWAGPIGTFHLTVDGHDPRTLRRRLGILSFCSPVPLQRTGLLQFEGTVRNFVPATDLKVMVVER